ncbi:unnamed protein product [Polarella glacialis]|uniref:Uncharacterized protein n=1 Tax=Polarella glacialis TaxID=89957 RepID=A0A813GCW5_POLGL|nr:unnamed protein product [Polarella glacialis]
MSTAALLTSLSQPSHVCDKEDLHRCNKLCEVSKAFLYIRAEKWLAARAGHVGLCIEHYCWDGSIKASLQRLRRQFFEALHLHHVASVGADEAHRLRLLLWDTYVECKSHQCHNSLKWAMGKYIQDKSTLRSACITMEPLRNGFDELEKNSRAWIRVHLAFEDWHVDCIEFVWSMLGFRGEWLDLLVKLQIRFVDDKLKVAAAFEIDGNTEQLVYMALLQVWKFAKFTDSRWATIGCTSRSLLSSTILGLESLVAHVLQNPASSSYYIKGFARYDQKVHELVAIISTSSFVADAVLELLFEDDRLPRNLEACDREICDEINYVFNIGSDVWKIVARACRMSEEAIRHASISSALVQGGLISSKLREARQLPWSLLQGDRQQNLDDLAKQTRPVDEVAGKIWELLQKEYDRGELEKGLDLLSEAGWCATTVEQGHVKASRIMQKHPEYTEDTMRSRAMVGSMSMLFAQDPDEKHMAGICRQTSRLEKYKPQYFTGRQLYVRRLKEASQSLQDSGRYLKIMKGHGKQWVAMSEDKRLQYEREAEEERDIKRAGISAKLFDLRQELIVRQDQVRHDKGTRDSQCLRLSACRLSDHEQLDFEQFYHSEKWTAKHVKELRDKAATATGHIDDHWKAALAAMDVSVAKVGVRPSWVGVMAHHRVFFSTCVLKMFTHPPFLVHHFAFVYASQNPLIVCLVKIQQLAGSASELHIEDWQDQDLKEWEHEFQVAVPSFHFSDELLFQTDFTIEVLPEMINMPRGRMASDSEFVSWKTILRELGQFGGADEPVAEQQPDHDDGAPAAHELPWLAHFWDHVLPLQATFPSSKKKKVGADSAQDSDSESEGQSIVDRESAIHEFYEKRLEMSLGEAEGDQFTWQLRGRSGTITNTGLAYDLAVKLCKFWCRKLNHMLGKWIEHGLADGFVLREAAEIIATGHVGAAKRVAQIRAVVPKLVPVPVGL